MQDITNQKSGTLKKVYLYLVSLVSLMMLITASVILLNIALKAWVFRQADNNSYNYACPASISMQQSACDTAAMMQQQHKQVVSQRENDAARAIALIIVAAPVFWYHWRLVRKET